MSVAAIVSKVRRLQRIQAERLNPTPPKAKRLTREQERERARSLGFVAPRFEEYFDDPVGFGSKLLGIQLWRKQRRILTAIARKKKVAVRSGQKTGKSTAFVVAALWWAATRSRGRVFLTAPGNAQVRNVLWKELRRVCYSTAPGGKRVVDILGVEPALLPSTGMQWPDGREILGFSADTPETMQGLSGPEMLVLVDEGSGVRNDIFEAIEGNLAAGGHVATASQPTQQAGWFFDAFHSHREHWERIDISSEETPNCTGEEDAIPGLADPNFIDRSRAEHGEDSAFYLVRIKGEFAGTASNAIVGLAAIDAARKRWSERTEEPTDPLEYGLDVARFGDDETALAPRRGKRLYDITTVNGFDTVAVVGMVMADVRSRRRTSEVPTIKIDAGGGYGGGVADLLRAQHGKEVHVVEVNSAEASDTPDEFTNVRTQLHFAVADWLKGDGELPDDTKLEAELLAPTYSFDARARRKVEGKDEIKKRLKRSPDRADAVALSILKRGGKVLLQNVTGTPLRMVGRGY